MDGAAEDSALTAAVAVLTAWERHFSEPDASETEAEAVSGDTLMIGVRGGLFAAERFVCRCEIGRVAVDAEISLGGAFASPDAVEQARGDALAVVRAALAALQAEADGRDWLPNDPAARLRIWASEGETGYAVTDGVGEVCESGDGWEGLVRLLEKDSRLADFVNVWV